MSSGKLRVEYQKLANIGQQFAHEAAEIEKLAHEITQGAEQLYAQGWTGIAADTFYNELGEMALPATHRLGALLQETGDTIAQVTNQFYEVDVEVANLFRKQSQVSASQNHDPHMAVNIFWSSFLDRAGNNIVDTGKGLVTMATLGPIELARQLYNSKGHLVKAFDKAGGGVEGIWAVVNEFNPLSQAIRAGDVADEELGKGFEAEARGDYEAAAEHYRKAGEAYADTAKAAVDTGMVVGGTAKFLAETLEGESVKPGAGEADEGSGNVRGCFVAGTSVHTTHGPRAIERLSVHQTVFSTDPLSGRRAEQWIRKTFVHIVPVVLTLQIGGSTITCSPEHPFWVPGCGWREAGNLRAGTPLLTIQGSVVAVDTIQRHEGSFTVYNMEVEGLHTYYVSELGILVHNKPRNFAIAEPLTQAVMEEMRDRPGAELLENWELQSVEGPHAMSTTSLDPQLGANQVRYQATFFDEVTGTYHEISVNYDPDTGRFGIIKFASGQ